MDTERQQSKDCDQWFDGKNWKRVTDACQQDKLCRRGVIGPNGWDRIIKAEDYSLAEQTVNEARTAPPLEPFLFFSDRNGSYQGSGWIKHDLLVGCHKVEGEGKEMTTQCSVSDNASVQQNPHSHLIAGLSKGTTVLSGNTRASWSKSKLIVRKASHPARGRGMTTCFDLAARRRHNEKPIVCCRNAVGGGVFARSASLCNARILQLAMLRVQR